MYHGPLHEIKEELIQMEKQAEQRWRDYIARLTAMADERELRVIYSFALHLVRGKEARQEREGGYPPSSFCS